MTPDERPRRPAPAPPIRALFQQRVGGDDALLRLARLRFAQAGLGAELYADSPGQLERVLGFAPASPLLPTVHLGRDVDLLRPDGLAAVEAFARGFAGRVAGLVVHDKAHMADRAPDLVAVAGDLASRLAGLAARPTVFLEYAAGMEPERFVELGRRLRGVDGFGQCIDVGHVGIKQAAVFFGAEHPDLDLWRLHRDDERLPDLAEDVQRAVGSALPVALEMTQTLGALGKPLHFHLHDGHPLIAGLSDHFSFLLRVPVPFDYRGKRSLAPLYGPPGLARLVQRALDSCGAGLASFTLEIHQAEGRLPLDDAAPLFRHWSDLANAERMNYWLSVLADNAALAVSGSAGWADPSGADPAP